MQIKSETPDTGWLYIRNFQPTNTAVHPKLDGTTYIYF